MEITLANGVVISDLAKFIRDGGCVECGANLGFEERHAPECSWVGGSSSASPTARDKNEVLLRELYLILNAYQDIEDALTSEETTDAGKLEAIQIANDIIGTSIGKLYPG